MSLLFHTLSRFFIAFLPRSKCLLISWLQSLSAVILKHKKIKSVTVSIFSPSICHEVMGLNAMISVFKMLSFKPHLPPSLLSYAAQDCIFHSAPQSTTWTGSITPGLTFLSSRFASPGASRIFLHPHVLKLSMSKIMSSLLPYISLDFLRVSSLFH